MDALFARLHEVERTWIVAIQTALPDSWTPVFQVLSVLGEDVAYLVFLATVWVMVSRRNAARIALVLFFSFFLNSLVKEALHQPRPFQAFSDVLALGRAGGNGIPSGHAQSSLLFWGLLAAKAKRHWFTLSAVSLALAIAFSRVALGVHFPSDILGGWTLALALGTAALGYGDSVAAALKKLDARAWVRGAALFSGLGMAVHPSATSAAALGAWFGCVAGLALSASRETETPSPESLSRRSRFAALTIILGGSAAFYLGLQLAFPGEGASAFLFFRFVRYALIGIWVSGGVPMLHRLGKVSQSDAAREVKA